MRNCTPCRPRNSTVSSRPSSDPGLVRDRHDLHAPIDGLLAVARVDAQARARPRPCAASPPRPGRSCRSRPAFPRSRSAATASPTAVHVTPGSQPRSITSAPSARNCSACRISSSDREPGCVVDLGEDLDVDSRRSRAAGCRRGRSAGEESRRSSGPVRPGPPGLFSTIGAEVALAIAGQDHLRRLHRQHRGGEQPTWAS